jgi:hypothetical protein
MASKAMAEIPAEVMDRLREFARTYGRRWRAELRGWWVRGSDADDPLLRRARNIIGPSGLDRIKIEF